MDDGKGGGGVLDDGGVHSEGIENGRTVHHYVITARPVLGVGEITGVTGGDAVVVAGRHKSGRGKVSGGGGGGGRIGRWIIVT